jgi:hypothetical protein
MTKRAEMETRITGTDAGIRDLGGLEEALKRLGKTGQRTGAFLRDMHKEWQNPTTVSTAVVKMGAQVIGGQIKDAAAAIAEPAKTSYAQALAKAVEYRDATQRIATSTGQGYGVVGEQINQSAQRLGILPGRVSEYSRTVRQLTGDWQGAMSGLDAYQNRALKTDRAIEEMIPTAATLAQTFGLKATDDVNKFFGTLDRQAKNAGMSAELAERAFISASGSLAMLTNAKPQQLSALTTAIMANAPTPEIGMSRIGAVGGILQNHMRYIEARMRKQGKLGKDEHLYDEQGQLRGDKMFDALEFLQGDLAKFYGTKDRKELIGRIAQSGMMSLQDAAGLLGLDVGKARKSAEGSASAENTTAAFLSTGAGGRTVAEARKDIRDINLGSFLLPGQDAAVAAGGGAAGIAIASAGQIFDKAASTFWNAVELFAGATDKAGGGGGFAGNASGTALGSLLGGSGQGVVANIATGAAMTAALPIVAMAATAYFGYKDITSQKKDYDDARAKQKQDKEKADAQGMDLGTYYHLKRRGIEAKNDVPLHMMADPPMIFKEGYTPISGPWRDVNAPTANPAVINTKDQADAHAQAMDKLFSSKVLKVQLVQAPVAPPGQSQPL